MVRRDEYSDCRQKRKKDMDRTITRAMTSLELLTIPVTRPPQVRTVAELDYASTAVPNGRLESWWPLQNRVARVWWYMAASTAARFLFGDSHHLTSGDDLIGMDLSPSTCCHQHH